MASHGVTLAIVAVSLEPPHPVCVEVSRGYIGMVAKEARLLATV